MITRRELIIAFGVCAFAVPLRSFAQQSIKVWRIGFMHTGSRNAGNIRRSIDEGFLRGMRELGYFEGKNLQIEWRFAEGKAERLPALAAELIREEVSLIVAGPTLSVRAAQRATSRIPIVMAAVPDPVADGLVTSLRYPGGNTTGISGITTEISAKYVELLHDAIPKLTHIALFVFKGSSRSAEVYVKQSEAASKATGIKVIPVWLMKVEEIEAALKTAVRDQVGAIMVPADPVLASQAPQINELALKSRLPTIYASYVAVEQGGFMSYGPDFSEQWRRAATYVDKILKGAKPGDLPIEQPTKFEMAVNLKTAKALGIIIPQSILVRADRVIE